MQLGRNISKPLTTRLKYPTWTNSGVQEQPNLRTEADLLKL